MKLDTTPKFKVKQEDLPKKEESTNSVATFISYLQSCSTTLKRMHWKTTSYATHKALDKCVDNLLDITDKIAEQSSGYLGVHLSDFQDFPSVKDVSKDPYTYVKEVKEYCQKDRYVHFSKEYSPIQNVLDELIENFDQTLYLLTLK